MTSRKTKAAIVAAIVVVVALLALRFGGRRPTVRLSDGNTIKLHNISHTPDNYTVPARTRQMFQRVLPHWLLPRSFLPNFSVNGSQSTVWIEGDSGSLHYVCTLTASNAPAMGPTPAYQLRGYEHGTLGMLFVDEFPPTETMQLNFYAHDRKYPVAPEKFVTAERFVGSITVPTPAKNRAVILSTNLFPARTNMHDVEVTVERVEYITGGVDFPDLQYGARIYFSFKENGQVSTNWDVRSSFLIDGVGSRNPAWGRSNKWVGNLREVYGNPVKNPQRGWNVRANVVRTKNFPTNELITINDVPVPGVHSQDWSFSTNVNGSEVTLYSMKVAALTHTRPLKPTGPGLVIKTSRDVHPRIAEIETDTAEKFHDPVNYWDSNFAYVPLRFTNAPSPKTLTVQFNVQQPRRVELAGIPSAITNSLQLKR